MTDTVILKSPTTTPVDHEQVAYLADIAGVDPTEFGLAVFKCRGGEDNMSVDKLVGADAKEFQIGDATVLIAQHETVDLPAVMKREEEIREHMRRLRDDHNYEFVLLLVTDIVAEGSQFFCEGNRRIVNRVFGIECTGEGGTWMPGVLSRKKQVAARILGGVGAAGPRAGGPLGAERGGFPPAIFEKRDEEAVECRGFFIERPCGGGDFERARERLLAQPDERALLSSRPPQLRSGQNPTPSPRPIMFFTTAGLSLSKATRGAKPGLGAGIVAHRAKRAAAGQADERLVGQVGQRQGPRRRAAGRHRDADALLEAPAPARVRTVLVRRAHRAHPQVPAASRRLLRDDEARGGMCGAVRRDGVDGQPRGRLDGEVHGGLLAPRHHRQLLGQVVEGCQEGTDAPLERFAARRQPHVAPDALEQRHAQLVLEPPDGLRERRLRHVELLRAVRHVLRARHLVEVPQLLQFHCRPFAPPAGSILPVPSHTDAIPPVVGFHNVHLII